ncbi:cold shock domain-containing protein [Chryseobacterium sp. MEBOG06]|nr:cold shock domain-containing protein [Chryseobacterium sp. MEBOG06]
MSPEGGGVDIFVHNSALKAAGLITLSEGERVSFEVVTSKTGKLEAAHITLSQ